VGRAAIPNRGNGVLITDGAQAIQVGGLEGGARNLISGNALDGVRISGEGLADSFNSVLGTSSARITAATGRFPTARMGSRSRLGPRTTPSGEPRPERAT